MAIAARDVIAAADAQARISSLTPRSESPATPDAWKRSVSAGIVPIAGSTASASQLSARTR